MKKMRRMLAFMLIIVMAIAVTACGTKSDGTLSKGDYKKKVQSLAEQITTESADVQSINSLSATDPAKAKDDLKVVVDKLKPLYKELGELKAPKDFEEQQSKLKTGTDASIEVLDLTLELLELASAETIDETKLQEAATNLQTKTTEYATALTDMDTVIAEITK